MGPSALTAVPLAKGADPQLDKQCRKEERHPDQEVRLGARRLGAGQKDGLVVTGGAAQEEAGAPAVKEAKDLVRDTLLEGKNGEAKDGLLAEYW